MSQYPPSASTAALISLVPPGTVALVVILCGCRYLDRWLGTRLLIHDDEGKMLFHPGARDAPSTDSHSHSHAHAHSHGEGDENGNEEEEEVDDEDLDDDEMAELSEENENDDAEMRALKRELREQERELAALEAELQKLDASRHRQTLAQTAADAVEAGPVGKLSTDDVASLRKAFFTSAYARPYFQYLAKKRGKGKEEGKGGGGGGGSKKDK